MQGEGMIKIKADRIIKVPAGVELKPAPGFTERITLEEATVREVQAVLDNQRCVYVLWRHGNDVVYCDKPGWIPLYTDTPPGPPYVCHDHDLAGRALKAERKRDDKRFAGCKTRAEAIAVRDGEAA
jgi:hypothetical protein